VARGTDGEGDGVVLRIESGDESVRGDRWAAALLAAAGPDPFALVERAVARAAALSGARVPPAALAEAPWAALGQCGGVRCVERPQIRHAKVPDSMREGWSTHTLPVKWIGAIALEFGAHMC
jgi:hypothetical protein